MKREGLGFSGVVYGRNFPRIIPVGRTPVRRHCPDWDIREKRVGVDPISRGDTGNVFPLLAPSPPVPRSRPGPVSSLLQSLGGGAGDPFPPLVPSLPVPRSRSGSVTSVLD